MDFTAKLERIKRDHRYENANLVAIQIPEGLKRKVEEIQRVLGEKKLIFLGDPFWGACDIPQTGSWDLLIQFGHSPIPNLNIKGNVLFEELQDEMNIDLNPDKIPFDSLLLTSNVTYSSKLPEIKRKLEDSGKKVTLKKGDSRIFYPGQILGCNVSAARGEEKNVLFIGEGIFHPLGISLALQDKNVIAFNPVTGEYLNMEKEKRKFLSQRYSAIDAASRAEFFGIIVSSKIGQTRSSIANVAMKILSEKGKRAFILVLDLIRDEELVNFPAEVYVNTACPRVTIEDYSTFSRPVISFYELEMALGMRDKSRYIFDEIVMTDAVGSSSFWRGDESSGDNRRH
ncbi:MAG: diphthamide biosynthesis enzyme Dph2 [Thermoplasmatales archaeon]